MRKAKTTPKILAMEVKGDCNAIISDGNYKLDHPWELTTLFALVNYMDTLILRCLDRNGNVTNRLWITSRLMEAIIVLQTSKVVGIKDIVKKLMLLEHLMNLGATNDKGNKGRGNYRPPCGRKEPKSKG